MKYGGIPGVSDRVSRLILGTDSFSPETQDLVSGLLDAFVAAGGTAIDTAHGYGRGDSERAVGEWLRVCNCRNSMTIVGKGVGFRADGVLNLTPEAIDAYINESLERLQVKTIDLYLLHKDDPDVPVGPIVECLNRHIDAGRIRAFGGSNWSVRRVTQANEYAENHGLQGFAASSPNFSLAVPREPMWTGCISLSGDSEAQAWYRRSQIPVLAWSAQARGFFTGYFSAGLPAGEVTGRPTAAERTIVGRIPARNSADADVVRVYDTDDNRERLRRARKLATRMGCTATQVALAWVLHQPLNVFALVGPRAQQELDDALAALHVSLDSEELAWLNLEV